MSRSHKTIIIVITVIGIIAITRSLPFSISTNIYSIVIFLRPKLIFLKLKLLSFLYQCFNVNGMNVRRLPPQKQNSFNMSNKLIFPIHQRNIINVDGSMKMVSLVFSLL